VSPRLHRALVWTHRWVGLTVGLVFTIVSVSGTLLLFQPQYFRWAHGELFPERMSTEVGSLDRWVENARNAVPHLHGPIAVWAPHVEHNATDAGMLVFDGQRPGGLGNMGFVGVLVAPDTGNVLGIVDIDRSPAYAPLFLHRDLWAGSSGQIVSGIMAIGTLVLLVLGLYLWWPALVAQIPRKLAPRPVRKTFTRARPLHDWVGVWTLPVLLVLTATGLYLVRPTWIAPVLEIAAGPENTAPASAQQCASPIGFDAAIARAMSLVPGAAWKAVYPTDSAERWELTFATNGNDALHRETHVIADLQCGTVTVEATPENRSTREAAEMWLIGLHDGTALGTPGMMLVSFAGLSPLLLMWSGLRMWLRRRNVSGARAEGRQRVRDMAPAAGLSQRTAE
jgi:uncharacterized iron-regulated membrane protein